LPAGRRGHKTLATYAGRGDAAELFFIVPRCRLLSQKIARTIPHCSRRKRKEASGESKPSCLLGKGTCNKPNRQGGGAGGENPLAERKKTVTEILEIRGVASFSEKKKKGESYNFTQKMVIAFSDRWASFRPKRKKEHREGDAFD